MVESRKRVRFDLEDENSGEKPTKTHKMSKDKPEKSQGTKQDNRSPWKRLKKKFKKKDEKPILVSFEEWKKDLNNLNKYFELEDEKFVEEKEIVEEQEEPVQERSLDDTLALHIRHNIFCNMWYEAALSYDPAATIRQKHFNANKRPSRIITDKEEIEALAFNALEEVQNIEDYQLGRIGSKEFCERYERREEKYKKYIHLIRTDYYSKKWIIENNLFFFGNGEAELCIAECNKQAIETALSIIEHGIPDIKDGSEEGHKLLRARLQYLYKPENAHIWEEARAILEEKQQAAASLKSHVTNPSQEKPKGKPEERACIKEKTKAITDGKDRAAGIDESDPINSFLDGSEEPKENVHIGEKTIIDGKDRTADIDDSDLMNPFCEDLQEESEENAHMRENAIIDGKDQSVDLEDPDLLNPFLEELREELEKKPEGKSEETPDAKQETGQPNANESGIFNRVFTFFKTRFA